MRVSLADYCERLLLFHFLPAHSDDDPNDDVYDDDHEDDDEEDHHLHHLHCYED